MSATTRKGEPSASVGLDRELDDDTFYEQVRSQLRSLQLEKVGSDTVFNIPIWGWPTNGKTCAVLTAVQYCDPSVNAIGVSRVKDLDGLRKLAREVPEYRDLSLPALAESTNLTLRQLGTLLFADRRFPGGTDRAIQYLLEARTIQGPIGYVLHPDIRGGSYEDFDATAANVLRDAHAVVALVDVLAYSEETLSGKEYRDDLLQLIHSCAKSSTPICVCLSKIDGELAGEELVDEVDQRLTAILGSQVGLKSYLSRISIFGDVEVDLEDLPPADARKPSLLVRAWAWTLLQALSGDRAEARRRVPTRATATRPESERTSSSPIPELRQLCDTVLGLGRVVGAAPQPDSGTFFLLGDNVLHEVRLDDAFELARTATFELKGWAAPDDGATEVLVAATKGALLAAPVATRRIWYGIKGQSLEAVALPVHVQRWAVVADDLVVGVDADGVLHSFRLAEGKWRSHDFVEGFCATCLQLTVLGGRHTTVVGIATTGGTAVDIKTGGSFGDRRAFERELELAAEDRILYGGGGLIAFVAADGSLEAGIAEWEELGGLRGGDSALCAVAADDPFAAWVDSEGHLQAARYGGAAVQRTTDEFRVLLEGTPNALTWDSACRHLALTFEDGRCAVYRVHGFADGEGS